MGPSKENAQIQTCIAMLDALGLWTPQKTATSIFWECLPPG